MINARNMPAGRRPIARASPRSKTAAARLERQAARDLRLYLASIVESSNDAIIGKTLDGTINAWNTAAERMFGYTAAEMGGRSITVLFPPDRLDEEREFLARIARGERIEHYETVRRRKDGSEVTVSVSISPIRNRHGEIIGAAKFARDITTQKAAEQRIQELQSELLHAARLSTMGQMAASITHELTQPLTAIANYLFAAQRLQSSPHVDPSLLKEAMDKALAQTARAGLVVRGFREFLFRGRTERRLEDFNEVVREVLPLALIDAKPTGIEVALLLGDNVGEVPIDKVQISQVILNLVRNAIEAMAKVPRRELAISTRWRDDEQSVEIGIADSGTGILPEIADKLFRPFVTSKATGMGIGLSICREIVDAHGGRLWAEPNDPAGTVFRLVLPRHTD
jgi:two-component system, LuxR family, sensor kinase FixL